MTTAEISATELSHISDTTKGKLSHISVQLGDTNKHFYALVDSGAGKTVCTPKLFPSHTTYSPCDQALTGVSGEPLEVLGQITFDITLKSNVIAITAIVVPKLNNNLLILGRDFLESNQCIIDYNTLTFKVKECILPLLYTCHDQGKAYSIANSRTVEIPPNSVASIECHARSDAFKRCTFSITGMIEQLDDTLFRMGIHLVPAMITVATGQSHCLVSNFTNERIVLYKDKKIGDLTFVHPTLVTTINHMSTDNAEHPSILPKDRWVNDIERLYDQLQLDKLKHLTESQIDQVKALIYKYKNIFSEHEDDLACTDILEQEIQLDTALPVRDKYRNIPLVYRKHAEKELQNLLNLGIIEPSTSTYHSPSFIIKKPNGQYRLITDFRLLNKHVVRSYQPLPSLEVLSSSWHNATLYSKLDFAKGFYQTKLAETSRHYTASSIPGIMFFQYCRTPLGLSSSPPFFQGLVEKIMLGLKFDEVVCYLDDVLTGAPTFQDMVNNLDKIFDRILTSKMLLKPSKVVIFQEKLKFLGVVLSADGLSVCPEKTQVVVNMLPPQNLKGVKSFIGMLSFFRRFIKDFSQTAIPLTNLLKKDAHFKWGEAENQAWQKLKDKLVQAPVLLHPDTNKPFTLATDSSSYAIGAILLQEDKLARLHPVSFGSKVLTSAEQKWSIVQTELYSLVYFCDKFKSYLLNHVFTVMVDNSALLHLETFKHNQSPRLWRWFESLQSYKFNVVYKPSKANPSDGPSRLVSSTDPNLHDLPATAEVSAKQTFVIEEAYTIPEVVAVVETADLPAHTGTIPEVVAVVETADLPAHYTGTIPEVVAVVETAELPAHTNRPTTEATPAPVSPLYADSNMSIMSSEGTIIKCTDNLIKTAQRSDATLSVVIDWVINDNKPINARALSPECRTYFNSFNRLSLKNDILYRSWEKVLSHERPTNLICLPYKLQNSVIKLCHDIPLSGHVGKEKTRLRLQSRFYFPKLQQKVDLYIDSCALCWKRKRNAKNPKATLTPYNGMYPNHIVQIDLMEALPRANGYHAILVIVCRFTMNAEAIPLRSTKVENIAKAILNTYISRYSVPTVIFSDRGGNVETAHVIKALYKLMGITKEATTSYRPSEDGGVERLNSTIKNLLWNYAQSDPRDWYDSLDQVLFAYRSAIHSSTGYSPFYLTYGRHPRLPMDIVMGTNPELICGDNYGEFASTLYHKLYDIYEFVREHLKSKQISQKSRVDKDAHVVTYKAGDQVYVWKPAPKDCSYRKFYDHYRGPYKIVKRVSAHTYKIALNESRNLFDIVHMEKCRLAQPIIPAPGSASRDIIIAGDETPGQQSETVQHDVPVPQADEEIWHHDQAIPRVLEDVQQAANDGVHIPEILNEERDDQPQMMFAQDGLDPQPAPVVDDGDGTIAQRVRREPRARAQVVPFQHQV